MAALRLGKLDSPDSMFDMLQGYPYSWEQGQDHSLNTFVENVVDHSLNAISTEKSGTIVLERCRSRPCERFMELSQLPSTDMLIQAAKRNPTVDSDDVVLIVTEGARGPSLSAIRRARKAFMLHIRRTTRYEQEEPMGGSPQTTTGHAI
ncbi:hypothetical protein N7463_004390 [Penicillium fimorum]|uniref:Uncharacterized protein n=1 Tax=Penicillium fimorum TaxID=1882269 RepID=A0A9W9Y2X6_9EURO|nr:hypothetical protein N7463_004390 [Penicillium fimorum]